MSYMAKRREDRTSGRRSTEVVECDLDQGFVSPIHSIKDCTLTNIRIVLLRSRYVQLLLSLTLIGCFLRLYNLGFNSLWLDEATTYFEAKQSIVQIWQTSSTAEFHPPLFNWIEHVMMAFGGSEIILRAVPALSGILAIPVFYLIGKEFRDRNVGLISAALLTVSYFGIFYSQEAKGYSVVLFVFSLVILFYLRALRSDKKSDWVTFGLLSALAVWIHYYVLIALGVIFLHAIITLRERLMKDINEGKKILIALCVMTVFILPLLILVVERYFVLSSSAPTYGVLGPVLILETFIRFSGGYSSLSWIIAVVYFFMMVAGFIFLFSEDRDRCLFSGMFLVLPLIISIVLSSKITMNPRYLIFLLPVFYPVIGMSFPGLYGWIPNRKILYAVLILIFALNAPLLAGYYSSYSKEDWRGFSGSIPSKTNDGDLVVLVPGYMSQPFDYYYSNSTDKTIEYPAYTGKDLEAINSLKENRTAYFIVTGDISAANPNGDAVAWLKDKTTLAGEDTGIYLFVSK